MKTIKNQEELNAWMSSGEIAHLNMKEWEGGYIYLTGATTGDIDLEGATTGEIYLREATTGNINLTGATTGYIDLEGATTGNINLEGATTGYIYLREATTGDINKKYTREDIDFLKRLPIEEGIFNIENWHSNDRWKDCKSTEEVHECGTTHCVRGWAEVEYFIKNKVEVEDVNSLYPSLKHLFFMTNEQFLIEREKIINNNIQ